MSTGKGCWTCKGASLCLHSRLKNACLIVRAGRKIQCDRTLPICNNCVKTQRKCQGYGVRLSWPKQNDKKRTILGTSPTTQARVPWHIQHMFINTTWRDIETYRRITSNNGLILVTLSQRVPRLERQPQPQVKHAELLNYCKHHSAISKPLARLIMRSKFIPLDTFRW